MKLFECTELNTSKLFQTIPLKLYNNVPRTRDEITQISFNTILMHLLS